MSNKLDQKVIEVKPLEIVFLHQNCDSSIKNLVFENLKPIHQNITKRLVDKELSKLKKTYNAPIIEEARRVLLAVKGLDFESSTLSKN